ncbi:hypothetical protein BDB01DRAFT_545826 [Pilobolus umbonatus]|nr:hypothetical protein BDB01DRAFT_545826 [Pilobolus umbonatus]
MSEQKIEKITKILIDEPVVTSSDSVSKRIAKRASALNMNGNVLREEVKSTPDKCGDNSIKITMGDIVLNTLNPRQQEIEGNEVIKGISYVFDNKFMAAKALFETKASTDPLHALALSSMAFLKAVMVTINIFNPTHHGNTLSTYPQLNISLAYC